MQVLVAATRFDVKSPQEEGARIKPVPFRIEVGMIREEAVIQNARSVDTSRDSMDVGRLQKWLENLSDDDLGKYKM